MSNPVTQPSTLEEQTDTDTVQSNHDEPIVVDNGPVELDFGPVHEVQQVNGNWHRKSGRFAHLLVLQTKPNGDIALFEDRDLDRTQPLTFHLGTQSEPEAETITFALAAEDSHRTVILNPGGVEFVKSDKRKLKPSGGQSLRISRIKNGTKFEIDLRDDGGFRSKRVSAILY